MTILIIIGMIALILGVFFIFTKEPLKKIENIMNKAVINTSSISYNNKIIGIFLVVFAIALFIVASSLKR